jgi:outer membrane protein assembly factor BamB
MLHEGTGCVAAYDVTTGKQLWQHPQSPPDGELVPFTWTGEHQSRDGAFLWTTDPSVKATSFHELWTIDPATGNPTRLAHETTYDLDPKGVVGGVAIVEAAPTYDSQKPEIWGIDLKTGQRLWQQGSRVKGTIDKQAVGVGAGVVTVVSCEGTKGGFHKPCYYETLDPRAGTTKGTSSKPTDLIPDIDQVTAVGELVLVRHSGQLVLLDPATAAVKATYGET